MAKRFTDNDKWKDAWFMDLPAKYKLFWLYLLDDCNHAGIWKVNFRVASFYIGEHLEHSEVKRMLKDRINILSDEYWYINKFIKYQYKCEIEGLNIKNKAHLSVIKLLNEYDYFKPLTSPLLGVKDKDKDKDKDKNKDKFFLDDVLYNVDDLKNHYLESETFNAVLSNKDLKLNNGMDLKTRLELFTNELKLKGRKMEKWNEYCSYFLNCLKKGMFTESKKTNPKITF